MTYRLIALDVDGTLLNDHHELSAANKESIQQAAKNGAEFVLCTGRGPVNTIPIMEDMGLNGFVITHNGAATVDIKTRKVVDQFPIQAEELVPYIDYCRQHDIHFDVNTAFGLYVDRADEMTLEVRSMYEAVFLTPMDLPLWADLREPVVKFSAFGSLEAMNALEKEWSTWNSPFYMVRSGDFFLDLMHKDASKGAALQRLAEKRGYRPEEVLAMGNYYNDITMLTFAGKGIAMDNSPVEVKAAADEITLSNNDSGVHHALVKHVVNL
ncbi:Cof-type HAD-IIB family hydrolase [Paenibacillus provencensis]|uniref:Cof-type HAD-IIB family hydrolase n=1 Tax=Paenibacillus provencensis TaxID=441151 RepID=A0ABW3PW83_9BACL|nr:Cof-type HAD-IIB family hydrolase [Paenibacillus sp. MER 78]MCM3130249.1 Cof-type HAD-IIB family hydrolase [Paenibacillus sp. MER 78]